MPRQVNELADLLKGGIVVEPVNILDRRKPIIGACLQDRANSINGSITLASAARRAAM